MRLLSVICILSNELIFVFLTFFMSLWELILSDFKNNMGRFLVFQACFNFFKALMFWKYFNFTLHFFFLISVTRENNTTNQTLYNTYCTTKLASNNTKHSYLFKRTQTKILQQLVNYRTCSYTVTHFDHVFTLPTHSDHIFNSTST